MDYAGFRKSNPYLDFEQDYTVVEDLAWKAEPSEVNRRACLNKRVEAKLAWEAMGNTVPSKIKFSIQ